MTEGKIKEIDNKSIKLEDLEYEFRLLLGARDIINFINDWDNLNDLKFGNIVNYFKDSAYIHLRNLYDVFEKQNIANDIVIPKMNLGQYHNLKPTLQKFVMHLNTPRDQKSVSNIRKGNHINTMIQSLTGEVETLWQEWIKKVSDESLKVKLEKSLRDARTNAKNDAKQLFNLLLK